MGRRLLEHRSEHDLHGRRVVARRAFRRLRFSGPVGQSSLAFSFTIPRLLWPVPLHCITPLLNRLFFAAAWNNRSTVEKPPGLLDEYYDILDQVSQGLPEQLQAKLDEVRQELPRLFRPDYPTAFQHDDLLENNIHVDEATGRITGIVDWSDAIIAPFGVSLGGLETILGVQTQTSWHFHPSHLSLREHFWNTLYSEIGNISEEDRRSIEVARLFGLFRAHGFEEKDQAIVYLKALCLL
ncbi:hypothetical protein CDV31_016613 [Fusarium ambrosium]|uniref:Aminoglycoside phosphotransferase domain-containing protein n=1 Tax=Fusarium ambrosium TaxID=131363 RepID=A0A428S621_9HYPO|nr:hypothetical protein CDV31_016613 [Fusarium ambrosium]